MKTLFIWFFFGIVLSIPLAAQESAKTMAVSQDKSSPKYEMLTNDQIIFDGRRLTRIRRISDGSLGGYIEAEKNMSQDGSSFLDDKSKIYGEARLEGDAELHGRMYGSARVTGQARVYGEVFDFGRVEQDAVIFGQVYENGSAGGSATVHGQIFGSGRVEGHAKVFGAIHGHAVVGGNEIVFGDRQ
jgi:hypothetical protein